MKKDDNKKSRMGQAMGDSAYYRGISWRLQPLWYFFQSFAMPLSKMRI